LAKRKQVKEYIYLSTHIHTHTLCPYGEMHFKQWGHWSNFWGAEKAEKHVGKWGGDMVVGSGNRMMNTAFRK
jgi:hypothetical protein